jgi:D-glycero-D-manno-heptose 1,7-bisphosphate phosphatase
MNKAFFLDRDGVLNKTILEYEFPRPPKNTREIVILEGVIEGIQLLKANGFIPVVVTNQPDVARGHTTVGQVEEINSRLSSILSIDFFYTCFHDDSDSCECRKPRPGLIQQAVSDLNIDVRRSFLIGDRWRDIAAGQAAGCRSFFIDYKYPEKSPQPPFIRVTSLLEAVGKILGEQSEQSN